ncbi:hypothetical protein D3C81_1503680 [compost metagenome]
MRPIDARNRQDVRDPFCAQCCRVRPQTFEQHVRILPLQWPLVAEPPGTLRVVFKRRAKYARSVTVQQPPSTRRITPDPVKLPLAPPPIFLTITEQPIVEFGHRRHG